MEPQIYFREETSILIGIGMEVHNHLGPGFLEIVYKDAIEYEFKKQGIPYAREKEYPIVYKEAILPHRYFADFAVFSHLILDVKAQAEIHKIDLAKTLNYLKASKNKVGLILNFGAESLGIKRLIY